MNRHQASSPVPDLPPNQGGFYSLDHVVLVLGCQGKENLTNRVMGLTTEEARETEKSPAFREHLDREISGGAQECA